MASLPADDHLRAIQVLLNCYFARLKFNGDVFESYRSIGQI